MTEGMTEGMIGGMTEGVVEAGLRAPCPETIGTERLVLRRWREGDHAAHARLSGDPHVMRFFYRLRSLEEGVAEALWLDERFALDGFGPWAVEAPGVAPFIGFAGCFRVPRPMPFGPAVEVGWRLDAPYWGKGYAPEAARAALGDVFERTDVQEIVAYTARANGPSRRVMEKLGMSTDPADDFDHPAVPEPHPFRAHVLYRLQRRAFLGRAA
jgi:RimJ/RimL family protein N-acetyltransferase